MIALAKVPLARMTRTRRGFLPILGWSALALIGAMTTKLGADHVLRGTFGFVVIPLLAYGVVAAALGGQGLRASVRPLVLLGAAPPRAAATMVLVACLVSAILSAALGAIVCILAHHPGDPPLGADVTATAGIALLGGATYAAYFCAGSAIGKGAARGIFLAVDWLLGASGGFGSILVPRGHLTSLLGGGPAFELSHRASSVFLIVLAFLFAGAAIRLGRRPA